jgi:hypothetical protein
VSKPGLLFYGVDMKKERTMLVTGFTEAGLIKIMNFYMTSYGCKTIEKPKKGTTWPWEAIMTYPFKDDK